VAIKRLSEAETECAAARETLERSRETIEEQRATQERRFRLEDRLANLERKARAHLVEHHQETLTDHLSAVPEYEPPEDPFEATPVAAALAIARYTQSDAPVVLACDRFDTPATASEWLDAPVIRV